LSGSPGRRLYLLLVCLALACVAASVVFLAGFSMDLVAGARKYTQGEALWSKGQKDAVVLLQRYAYSHSEADFQQYLDALRVPSAYHQIRLELAKPRYDPAVLDRALGTIGVDPEDRVRLARRYRYFRGERHIAQAISLWAEADREMEELEGAAGRLHVQIASQAPDEAAIRQTLAEIHGINARLTSFEVRFSQSVAEASRSLYRVLVAVFAGCTGLLLLAGLAMYIRLFQRITDSEQRFRHLIDTAGEAIFILDGRSAAVLDANRKGEQILGAPVEHFAGTVLPLLCLEAPAGGQVTPAEISRLMPSSELQDPKQLQQLTERFTAMYDLDYGTGGVDASTPLTVKSDGVTSTTTSAASTILSGVISGNSSYSGDSTASYFSSALLASVQNLNLGG